MEGGRRGVAALRRDSLKLLARHVDCAAALREACYSPGLPSSGGRGYEGVAAAVHGGAAAVGLPASTLATRHLATLLLALPWQSHHGLSVEGQRSLEQHCQLAEWLQERGLVNSDLLLHALSGELASLTAELVWALHATNIVHVDSWLLQSSECCDFLVDSLVAMVSTTVSAVKDLVCWLAEAGFGGGGGGVAGECGPEARAVVWRVVERVELGDVAACGPCWLVGASQSVSARARTAFFSHVLHKLLLAPPLTTGMEALRGQEQWQTSQVPAHTAQLYTQIACGVGADEVVRLLRDLVDMEELHWPAVLTFTACSCRSPSPDSCRPPSPSVSGFICTLASEALGECHTPLLISALALARQVALEGGHLAPPYHDWFKHTFGDSSSSLVTTRRSLLFLLKTLTQVVPFEPAYCLQAHIRCPPRQLAKCQDPLRDYLALAKTRLADLKEPVPGQPSSAAPSEAVQAAVHQAVMEFGQSGRLPATVVQASMFRKPYFIGRFAPALLGSRPPEEEGGAREGLITALVREHKLPARCLAQYQQDCLQDSHRGFSGSANSAPSTDLCPLEALLAQLPTAAIQGTQELNRLLSTTSAVLAAGLAKLSTGSQGEHGSSFCIDLARPGISGGMAELVDALLGGVCQALLASYSDRVAARVTTHRHSWLPRLLAMLSSHPAVHPALFVRLWELLSQPSSLSPPHLLSLALLCAQLYHGGCSWAALVVEGVEEEGEEEEGEGEEGEEEEERECELGRRGRRLETSAEYCRSLLLAPPICPAPSACALLQFGVYFAQHAFLVAGGRGQGEGEGEGEGWRLIPLPLLRKMRYTYDRLKYTLSHQTLLTQDVQELATDVLEGIDALLEEREFQELWREAGLKPRQWLMWELCVDPAQDGMSQPTRLQYLRTTLFRNYLEGSERGGGCVHIVCLLVALLSAGCDKAHQSWNELLALLQTVCQCLLPAQPPALQLAVRGCGGEAVRGCRGEEAGMQRCMNVLHALPPSLLLTNSLTHPPSPEDVEQAGAFVEEEMAPALSEHFVLPVALSHYLLQALRPLRPLRHADTSCPKGLLVPLVHSCLPFCASLVIHWNEFETSVKEFVSTIPLLLGSLTSWFKNYCSARKPLPLLAGQRERLVAGVCAFHHLLTSPQQHRWPLIDELVPVVMDCCVRELSLFPSPFSLSRYSPSSTELRLLAIAKACSERRPGCLCCCCEAPHGSAGLARRRFPCSCSARLLPFVFFRLANQALPHHLPTTSAFLEFCLDRHRSIMQVATETVAVGADCEGLSALMIQDWTELVRQLISRSPLQALQELEMESCHDSLQPTLAACLHTLEPARPEAGRHSERL